MAENKTLEKAGAFEVDEMRPWVLSAEELEQFSKGMSDRGVVLDPAENTGVTVDEAIECISIVANKIISVTSGVVDCFNKPSSLNI